MKNLVFTMVALAGITAYAQSFPAPTDAQVMQLKGKVKRVIEEIEEVASSSKDSTIYTFNKKGFFTCVRELYGTEELKTDYIYKDLMVEMITHYDGKLKKRELKTLNKQGFPIEITTEDIPEATSSKAIYSYTNNGREVKIAYRKMNFVGERLLYNPEGLVVLKEVYKNVFSDVRELAQQLTFFIMKRNL